MGLINLRGTSASWRLSSASDIWTIAFAPSSLGRDVTRVNQVEERPRILMDLGIVLSCYSCHVNTYNILLGFIFCIISKVLKMDKFSVLLYGV